MKKILLHARHEDFRELKPVLEDLYHIDVDEGDFVQVKIFAPDSEVNKIIDKIREPLDLRYKENLIEVSTPDFVISSTLSRAEKSAPKHEKTPVELLLNSAKNYSSIDYWILLLTTIAGLIALTGLFLNNVVVIIGAMLLAPILGPIHSFAIYAATGRTKDALMSVFALFIYLVAILFVSMIATYVLNLMEVSIPETIYTLEITQEILLRTTTSPIYILMAIMLGLASIIAISKGFSESIAGVAVAAALLPPTVVAGISVILIPGSIAGAVVLTLDNVIGLIAGALIGTLIIGVAPRTGSDARVAKKFIKRTIVLIIIFIAVLTVISLAF
jgi:uncharacterized hydrophobic protein (TIGR00341 family)